MLHDFYVELQQHADEGRFVAARCAQCEALYLPPTPTCSRCLGDSMSWQALPARGVLHSHTAVVAPPAGHEKDAPYVLGLVDIPGAGRIMGVFSKGVGEDCLRIGASVGIVVSRRGEGALSRAPHYLLRLIE